MMKHHILDTTISLLALILALSAFFTGCAAAPVTTKVDKKKNGVTVVHHITHAKTYTTDRMVGVNAKGKVVSDAVVKVFDVGRLPDGHGGMREASRYYRIVGTPAFDLRLPKKSGNLASGPKTVFTPPNYSEPPRDQRVDDAVNDAQDAKRKLDAKAAELAQGVDQTNVMKGELQEEIDKTQAIANQLKAVFHTDKPAKPAPTDAEKAADGVDSLENFGKQVGN